MKEYAPEAIRNVVLAGHAGSGKTTLAEACLLLAGATERQGRVEDGNTVSDFLSDEVKRGSSIHAALLAFEYSNTKFNLIDAPGYADFFGEVCSAMSAAEDCVLVANAAEELELGIEAGLARARDKRTEIPIPDEVAGRIQELRVALIENDVECDNALMEKYLDSGDLSEEETQGCSSCAWPTVTQFRFCAAAPPKASVCRFS